MRPQDTKLTQEEKQAVKDVFTKAGKETLIHAGIFLSGFVLPWVVFIAWVTN